MMNDQILRRKEALPGASSKKPYQERGLLKETLPRKKPPQRSPLVPMIASPK